MNPHAVFIIGLVLGGYLGFLIHAIIVMARD